MAIWEAGPEEENRCTGSVKKKKQWGDKPASIPIALGPEIHNYSTAHISVFLSVCKYALLIIKY